MPVKKEIEKLNKKLKEYDENGDEIKSYVDSDFEITKKKVRKKHLLTRIKEELDRYNEFDNMIKKVSISKENKESDKEDRVARKMPEKIVSKRGDTNKREYLVKSKDQLDEYNSGIKANDLMKNKDLYHQYKKNLKKASKERSRVKKIKKRKSKIELTDKEQSKLNAFLDVLYQRISNTETSSSWNCDLKYLKDNPLMSIPNNTQITINFDSKKTDRKSTYNVIRKAKKILKCFNINNCLFFLLGWNNEQLDKQYSYHLFNFKEIEKSNNHLLIQLFQEKNKSSF